MYELLPESAGEMGNITFMDCNSQNILTTTTLDPASWGYSGSCNPKKYLASDPLLPAYKIVWLYTGHCKTPKGLPARYIGGTKSVGVLCA